MMISIKILLFIGLCIYVEALSLTAVLDDGTVPIDDGKTQLGNQVKIKCNYADGEPQKLDFTRLYFNLNGEPTEILNEGGFVNDIYRDEAKYTYDLILRPGGENYMEFTIKAMTIEDNGSYECRSTNPSDGQPKLSSTATVTAYAPTESVMIQNDESGELSLTAGPQTIFCTAKGGSRPTMSMKLGDDAPIAIRDEDIIVVETSTNESVTYTVSHTFTFNAQHDSKTLVCDATVETFETAQQSVVLRIQAPPVISCSPETQPAKEGESKEFICTVTGSPQADIKSLSWAANLNGHQIPADKGSHSLYGLSSTVTTEADGSFTVKLTVIASTDTWDMYTLVADNGVPPATRKIVELTEAKIGPVGSTSAISISLSLLGTIIMTYLLG